MKTDTVFKRAFNDALDLVAKLGDGEPLPSENDAERAARRQPHDGAQGPVDAGANAGS